METKLEDTMGTCREAVAAIEDGRGSVEDVCIQTRSLLLACGFVASTYSSVLTPELNTAIAAIFERASAAAERAAEGAPEDSGEVDYAKRIAQRRDEFRQLVEAPGLEENSSNPATNSS